MAREYRVLTALHGTAVPVPRTLLLGAADNPLGSSFYIMERVVGHICRDALPAGYGDTPQDRAAIGTGLIDVLAALHTIDPDEVGVTDPDAERHRRQSMILVPKDAPGVSVQRSTSVFGYDDGAHGGHAEIVYDDGSGARFEPPRRGRGWF